MQIVLNPDYIIWVKLLLSVDVIMFSSNILLYNTKIMKYTWDSKFWTFLTLPSYHKPDEAGSGEHYGRAKCTLHQRYVNQCSAMEVEVSWRYESGGKGTTWT